jgi:hypothetical protein
MSNASNASRSLPHRIGVAGPARVRAFSFQGIGVSIGLVFAIAVLLAPSAASAAFTRKFERAVYRAESSVGHPFTERCTEAEAKAPGSPCLNPGGVAVNPEGAAPENALRVGNLGFSGEVSLDEFQPAYAPGDNAPDPAASFKAPTCVEDTGKGEWEESKCLTKAMVAGTGDFEKHSAVPESLAIERMLPGNGDVYAAGGSGFGSEGKGGVEVYENGGKYLETWKGIDQPNIAIDDSAEPSEDPSACGTGPLSLSQECFVYVAGFLSNAGPSGDLSVVAKFNSKGVAEPFADSGDPATPYVEGNEITGRPEGCGKLFATRSELGGITVDPAGDIYISDTSCKSVFEYEPSGKYLRAFELQEAPEIGHVVDSPGGLAFDPVSHNLLVTVGTTSNRNDEGEGAIDEFETKTGRFVAQITKAGESALALPVAVTVDSKGYVYVSEPERSAVDVWGPGGYYPNATLDAASERTSTSAVLNGSVNPAQEGNPTPAPISECYFQYVEAGAYEQALANKEEGFAHAEKAPCEPAEIHAGLDEAHPVSARLEHLVAGTAYRYRLVATTEKAANGGTVETESLTFTAPAPAEIVSASAANLSSTSADLHAEINPLGADTSYFFEYGPSAAYGHVIPSSPASIGLGGPTGSSAESALQHIGDLQPGTTYHFRVVASSECEAIEHPHRQCVVDGEDETFTTLPAPVSSERGYELVTPANKQGGSDMFSEGSGGSIENVEDVGTPTESGDGFVLRTQSLFGEFPFASVGAYVFRREYAQGRWGYTSLAAPSLGVQVIESDGFPLFEPFEAAKVAFADQVGSRAAEEGAQIASLIGPPGGPYSALHEDPRGFTGVSTGFVAGSRDLGHVILASALSSTCPGAEKVKYGDVLCEWSGGYETLEDGEARPVLELVNVSPQDESEPTSECGARLGSSNGLDGVGGLARNAVSASGSRVFFTAPGPETTGVGKCWNGEHKEEVEGPKNAPQLYARVAHEEEGGEVTHQTIELSTPAAGVRETGSKEPGGRPVQYPAIFTGASEDGSKVFFETRTWLTADHPSVHDAELYEWEAEGTGACSQSSPAYNSASKGCLSRVSTPIGEHGEPDPAAGAHTLFVPAVSADGSTVYFTAFDALAPGGVSYATVGQKGGEPVNLYRYDTVRHNTSFVAPVATLDFSDEPECETLIKAEAGVSSNWTAPCAKAGWYTTPDGRFLLFGASLPIHGYNEAANGCAEPSLPSTQGVDDGRCSELYRYSAAAAEAGEQAIVCVSCGSGSADSAGNARFDRSASNGPDSSVVQGMSDNGEYVFFDSQAALVPAATNETLDTYQWHEDLQTHARTVSLIGSGSDPASTFFLGYSPYYLPDGERVEGGNVFIGTHAKLSSQQTNSVGNVYDARICESGSPCIQPPAGETAQCEGGTCQTPPALGLFQSPATNTLSSSGNIAPGAPRTAIKKPTPKCKQGFVKKKVEKKEACVKKKSGKRAKKSSKRKVR